MGKKNWSRWCSCLHLTRPGASDQTAVVVLPFCNFPSFPEEMLTSMKIQKHPREAVEKPDSARPISASVWRLGEKPVMAL